MVLPDTFAKFRGNLRNSEKWDTSKEMQNVIKASYLKLLLKIQSHYSSISYTYKFSEASLT
jgi:hypothetical protein